MGGHGSQYIVLSELLSDQAAFITSPKTSLANYWGGIAPLPPVSTGLRGCGKGMVFVKVMVRLRVMSRVRIRVRLG